MAENYNLNVNANYKGNLNAGINGLNASMGRLTTVTQGLGAAMGATFGIIGAGMLVRNSIRVIGDFDEEMVNMAAIVEKSRSEVQGLEEEIRNVAATSINTAGQVAKTATALFTLGKSEAEVKKILPVVNNLSIALKAIPDEAGELLVGTLNAFGRSADSAQEFADKVAKARTSTSLDFQRIRDSLGFVAPTAAILNLSLEKTLAIIGTLVDSNVKASRSGRLLNSSFSRLNKLGLSLDEALIMIQKSTDKTRTATELFGTEAFGLGIILSENTDKIEEYTKKIGDSAGTLDDLTKRQLEAFNNKLKIIKSQWDDLIISFEKGDGTLRGITDTISGLLTIFATLDKLTDAPEGFEKIGRGQYRRIRKEIEGMIGPAEQAKISMDRLLNPKTVLEYTGPLSRIALIVRQLSNESKKHELPGTIARLREELDLLEEKRENVSLNNIAALNDEIRALEKLITKYEEATNVVEKTLKGRSDATRKGVGTLGGEFTIEPSELRSMSLGKMNEDLAAQLEEATRIFEENLGFMEQRITMAGQAIGSAIFGIFGVIEQAVAGGDFGKAFIGLFTGLLKEAGQGFVSAGIQHFAAASIHDAKAALYTSLGLLPVAGIHKAAAIKNRIVGIKQVGVGVGLGAIGAIGSGLLQRGTGGGGGFAGGGNTSGGFSNTSSQGSINVPDKVYMYAEGDQLKAVLDLNARNQVRRGGA